MKKTVWGKSHAHLLSPTSVPFALKPMGLLYWWNSRCFSVASL